MFHREFPPDSRTVMDLVAKTLMLRFGTSVNLPLAELQAASKVQAEVELTDDGSIIFRVERH